ncbi:ribulose-phosphate 3-epimerase [Candidatus Gracilibacteria bacterium]|nr:ribulose-phosphate 3-epimerase [Candidatus Gracilibacteria bacterium]
MKISPSILDADFLHLQGEVDSIGNADRIHLDIMDGKYVPSTTIRASDLLNIAFPIETEAHLMCDNPETFFKEFVDLGVKGITFHIENTGEKEALRLLKELKEKGIRGGICIDGYTEPDTLSDDVLHTAGQILVMSVKAGKGGQSFMTESLDKIMTLRERGYEGEIEVDGGINLDNVKLLREAGADIVVVGSFVMKKPTEERCKVIEKFQKV